MAQDQNEIESRRKFLKTAGKFAIYTPPALMMMSKASANAVTHSYTESCKPGRGLGDENHCHSGPSWSNLVA